MWPFRSHLDTSQPGSLAAAVRAFNQPSSEPTFIESGMWWRWLAVFLGAVAVIVIWWLYGPTAGAVATVIGFCLLIYALAHEAGYHRAMAEHGLQPRRRHP